MNRKLVVLALVLSLGFVLAACTNREQGPVAVVNGEEISRQAFDREYEYALSWYPAEELGTAEISYIKAMVLEQLVNTALLVQQAEAAGFTWESVGVAEEMEELKAAYGGQAQLEQLLAQDGMTLEEFTAETARYLMIQRYLDTQLDLDAITVSEAEIREVFEYYQGEYGEDLELAEMKDYIIDAVKQQKANELLGEFVDSLRAEADIEYLIKL